MDYLSIAIKLATGMVGLVIVTRMLGKKEMSQVTPLDFVYALVLGGIVEDGIYDPAVSIWQILFGLAVWYILIYIVEKVTQHSDKVSHVLKGSPEILISHGKVNVKVMRKNHLDIEQVRQLLRLNGVFSVEKVSYAILENNGQLSVMQKASEEPLTREDYMDSYPQNVLTYLFVEKGKVDHSDLKLAGKKEEWLIKSLKEKGYRLENIEFAEWNEHDGFYIQEIE